MTILYKTSKIQREYWKGIKQIIHSKPKVSQRIIKILEGNREITDPTAIANVFNNFFANIGNSLAS
jgi:hypothetical protein